MLTRSEAIRLAAEHAEAASGLLTTAHVTGTDDVSRAGWHAVTSRALSEVAPLLAVDAPPVSAPAADDPGPVKALRAELFDVRGQLDAVIAGKGVVPTSMLNEAVAARDAAEAHAIEVSRNVENVCRDMRQLLIALNGLAVSQPFEGCDDDDARAVVDEMRRRYGIPDLSPSSHAAKKPRARTSTRTPR